MRVIFSEFDQKDRNQIKKILKENGISLEDEGVTARKSIIQRVTTEEYDGIVVSDQGSSNKMFSIDEIIRLKELEQSIFIIYLLHARHHYIKDDLSYLIKNGIFNILFQEDISVESVSELMIRGRSLEEARIYCDLVDGDTEEEVLISEQVFASLNHYIKSGRDTTEIIGRFHAKLAVYNASHQAFYCNHLTDPVILAAVKDDPLFLKYHVPVVDPPKKKDKLLKKLFFRFNKQQNAIENKNRGYLEKTIDDKEATAPALIEKNKDESKAGHSEIELDGTSNTDLKSLGSQLNKEDPSSDGCADPEDDEGAVFFFRKKKNKTSNSKEKGKVGDTKTKEDSEEEPNIIFEELNKVALPVNTKRRKKRHSAQQSETKEIRNAEVCTLLVQPDIVNSVSNGTIASLTDEQVFKDQEKLDLERQIKDNRKRAQEEREHFEKEQIKLKQEIAQEKIESERSHQALLEEKKRREIAEQAQKEKEESERLLKEQVEHERKKLEELLQYEKEKAKQELAIEQKRIEEERKRHIEEDRQKELLYEEELKLRKQEEERIKQKYEEERRTYEENLKKEQLLKAEELKKKEESLRKAEEDKKALEAELERTKSTLDLQKHKEQSYVKQLEEERRKQQKIINENERKFKDKKSKDQLSHDLFKWTLVIAGFLIILLLTGIIVILPSLKRVKRGYSFTSNIIAMRSPVGIFLNDTSDSTEIDTATSDTEIQQTTAITTEESTDNTTEESSATIILTTEITTTETTTGTPATTTTETPATTTTETPVATTTETPVTTATEAPNVSPIDQYDGSVLTGAEVVSAINSYGGSYGIVVETRDNGTLSFGLYGNDNTGLLNTGASFYGSVTYVSGKAVAIRFVQT